jgi:hypothetical protein
MFFHIFGTIVLEVREEDVVVEDGGRLFLLLMMCHDGFRANLTPGVGIVKQKRVENQSREGESWVVGYGLLQNTPVN